MLGPSLVRLKLKLATSKLAAAKEMLTAEVVEPAAGQIATRAAMEVAIAFVEQVES